MRLLVYTPSFAGGLLGECRGSVLAQQFIGEWEWVIEHTPKPLPELSTTQHLPEWQRLRVAAEAALRTFQVRGRLPEDQEI